MLKFIRGGFTGLLFVLATVFISFLITAPTDATINPQINFQGKLTKPDGTNATDGSYSITFAIYTVSTGGSNVWTETQSSVSVTDGIFRVALGSVTSLPGSVDFNGASLFLGIKVGADAEMTPRVQFTASPYAFNSDKLGGLASTGFVQLGPAAAQTDAGTNPGIRINKTSTGNQIQLENTGASVFVVDNTGNVILNQAANTALSIGQRSTNAAGSNLTISAGQGGVGAGANAGGDLLLAGGAGGGTNGAGGDLRFAAGAGSGSGVVGSIIFKNGTDSATSFQIQDSSSATLLVADTTNDIIQIGSATPDTLAVRLVLDTKNTLGDPTVTDGAIYYNSVLGQMRCSQKGRWDDCGSSGQDRISGFLKPATVVATTLTGVGLTTPTVSGTAASNPQTESNYVSFTTTAGANNVAGYATGAFTTTRLNYSPVFKARVRTGAAITTTQYSVGLSSAAISGVVPTIAAAAQATAYTAAVYNPAVNGGRWVCGSGDAANHSGVDTGVSVAINSYYDIVLDYYSISNTLICSISTNGGDFVSITKNTNIPVTTTNLGMNALVNNLTSGATRALSVANISVSQN